jgi:hypothetical protein
MTSLEKQLADRKAFIARIAQRHAAERSLVKSVETGHYDEAKNQYEDAIAEEYQRALKSSTFNPLSA